MSHGYRKLQKNMNKSIDILGLYFFSGMENPRFFVSFCLKFNDTKISKLTRCQTEQKSGQIESFLLFLMENTLKMQIAMNH